VRCTEPAMQQQTGITPAMLDYITRALAESKLAIYQRYLDAQEYAFVRAHYVVNRRQGQQVFR